MSVRSVVDGLVTDCQLGGRDTHGDGQRPFAAVRPGELQAALPVQRSTLADLQRELPAEALSGAQKASDLFAEEQIKAAQFDQWKRRLARLQAERESNRQPAPAPAPALHLHPRQHPRRGVPPTSRRYAPGADGAHPAAQTRPDDTDLSFVTGGVCICKRTYMILEGIQVGPPIDRDRFGWGGRLMRADSTLRGSPSLAPVTAPRHAPACPRCRGPLVQLEEPTCLPCGWADYRTPGLCGICRDPTPPGPTRFCSDSCVTVAGRRRKVLAARTRVDRGRCVRCGTPADATYCPRHKLAVRDAAIDWRARRRAAGRCLRCPELRSTLLIARGIGASTTR